MCSVDNSTIYFSSWCTSTYSVTPSCCETSGQSGKLQDGRVPFHSPEELQNIGEEWLKTWPAEHSTVTWKVEIWGWTSRGIRRYLLWNRQLYFIADENFWRKFLTKNHTPISQHPHRVSLIVRTTEYSKNAKESYQAYEEFLMIYEFLFSLSRIKYKFGYK